ncbi:hypothetical protein ILYODFUR_007267 [Ilyodon furcidens]|uniref:Secreted protein n=1 Tax=Ilyodon furcidens TaxID=33524 RepID=A0ABV0SM70_9TELE
MNTFACTLGFFIVMTSAGEKSRVAAIIEEGGLSQSQGGGLWRKFVCLFRCCWMGHARTSTTHTGNESVRLPNGFPMVEGRVCEALRLKCRPFSSPLCLHPDFS